MLPDKFWNQNVGVERIVEEDWGLRNDGLLPSVEDGQSKEEGHGEGYWAGGGYRDGEVMEIQRFQKFVATLRW